MKKIINVILIIVILYFSPISASLSKPEQQLDIKLSQNFQSAWPISFSQPIEDQLSVSDEGDIIIPSEKSACFHYKQQSGALPNSELSHYSISSSPCIIHASNSPLFLVEYKESEGRHGMGIFNILKRSLLRYTPHLQSHSHNQLVINEKGTVAYTRSDKTAIILAYLSKRKKGFFIPSPDHYLISTPPYLNNDATVVAAYAAHKETGLTYLCVWKHVNKRYPSQPSNKFFCTQVLPHYPLQLSHDGAYVMIFGRTLRADIRSASVWNVEAGNRHSFCEFQDRDEEWRWHGHFGIFNKHPFLIKTLQQSKTLIITALNLITGKESALYEKQLISKADKIEAWYSPNKQWLVWLAQYKKSQELELVHLNALFAR